MTNYVYRTLRLALLFCVMLSLQHQAFSKGGDMLQINSQKHALVAPKGKSYQWFYNSKQIPGATGQELVVTQGGNYAVKVHTEDGTLLEPSAWLAVTATGALIKIYIIGDSTVCNYKASDYPMTGWGQMLPFFFNAANVQVDNRAIGGRSSRSFYQEGRWTPIKDALKAGDYVFIQFGHNDRDTKPERYTSVADYKVYLTRYVNEARAKGAIPVLVSPMVMNAWQNGTMRNVFTENGNNYRGGMLEVATQLSVPFIDLNMKSWNLYKTLGQSYITRFVYHSYQAGEYPNYPSGISDGTHFQEMGAIDNARMVVEGIAELKSQPDMEALVQYLNPQYTIAINTAPANAASLTTRTATYPAGITVTLKTLPKSGSSFQSWQNATGTAIATRTLTTVKAGSSVSSYTAMYQGGACTTLWYADTDGDGKGDPATTVQACTQPQGYVQDKSDLCPSDGLKSSPGVCGCGQTELSCVDCSGTPQGTAQLDNCGRCTGGTTGKTACTATMEVEDVACSYEGVLETTNAGYKGSSYINTSNVEGASVSLSIAATATTQALLSIRYATNTDRPAGIWVNNTLQESLIPFAGTGTFTSWKSIDVNVALLKGENLIKLSATTSAGLPNIDQVGLVSTGLSSGICVVTALDKPKELRHISFANPFKDHLLLDSREPSAYTIASATGSILESGTIHGQTQVGHLLTLGIYYLTVYDAHGAHVYKVIKQEGH